MNQKPRPPLLLAADLWDDPPPPEKPAWLRMTGAIVGLALATILWFSELWGIILVLWLLFSDHWMMGVAGIFGIPFAPWYTGFVMGEWMPLLFMYGIPTAAKCLMIVTDSATGIKPEEVGGY